MNNDELRKITDNLWERFNTQITKPPKPRIFGFELKDMVLILGIFMAIYAFYIRTNDTLDRLTRISERLSDFAENSDSYHSAMTGTQFKQGHPANPNYNLAENKKPIVPSFG